MEVVFITHTPELLSRLDFVATLLGNVAFIDSSERHCEPSSVASVRNADCYTTPTPTDDDVTAKTIRAHFPV